MKEINKAKVADASDGGEQRPNIKTRRILIGISKKYGIEIDDIKMRYKEIMGSEEVEKGEFPLDDVEIWAAKKLLWQFNDENEIDNYERSIEEYCDLISELAVINDKMARTSIKISQVFGEKYSFVKALKEVEHVRRSLENRMHKNFFGGE